VEAPPTAVHFGAGKIGRGLLGQVYAESGWRFVFVDIVDALIAELCQSKTYPIRFLSSGMPAASVRGYSAIHGEDTAELSRELVEVRLITTAVIGTNLPAVARTLVLGLKRRADERPNAPLDIIAVENMHGAAACLRGEVLTHLEAAQADWVGTHVGFVEATVGRTVPEPTAQALAEHPLMLDVEAVDELYFDAAGFRHTPPALARAQTVTHFEGYEARKLYVHNMAHAGTAYMGALHGHETIAKAIRDAGVREAVEAAMEQSCDALVSKYGLDSRDLAAYRAKLIERFENPLMKDSVARVARDPARKLQPEDRLLGALALCQAEGMACHAIARLAAAAFAYEGDETPAWRQIRGVLIDEGIERALSVCCGMGGDTPASDAITQAWQELRERA